MKLRLSVVFLCAVFAQAARSEEPRSFSECEIGLSESLESEAFFASSRIFWNLGASLEEKRKALRIMFAVLEKPAVGVTLLRSEFVDAFSEKLALLPQELYADLARLKRVLLSEADRNVLRSAIARRLNLEQDRTSAAGTALRNLLLDSELTTGLKNLPALVDLGSVQRVRLFQDLMQKRVLPAVIEDLKLQLLPIAVGLSSKSTRERALMRLRDLISKHSPLVKFNPEELRNDLHRYSELTSLEIVFEELRRSFERALIAEEKKFMPDHVESRTMIYVTDAGETFAEFWGTSFKIEPRDSRVAGRLLISRTELYSLQMTYLVWVREIFLELLLGQNRLRLEKLFDWDRFNVSHLARLLPGSWIWLADEGSQDLQEALSERILGAP